MTPALWPWLIAIAVNTGLLAISRWLPKKLLTPAGYLHAWVLGVLVWGSLGWAGYSVVMVYFLVGSGVTRIGLARKEAAGIAEQRAGVRGPENVWGSALTAAVCALGVVLVQAWGGAEAATGVTLLQLGYVASFSTKLADTTASEVGKAYGRRTFLITTLRPVPPGTEGAVSLEGTLAGLAGAALIALVGWGTGLVESPDILLCLIAAFGATNLESVVGATLQHRVPGLTNERVNMINTTLGAAIAVALAQLLP